MLLISPETAAPFSPFKSPSLAVALAINLRSHLRGALYYLTATFLVIQFVIRHLTGCSYGRSHLLFSSYPQDLGRQHRGHCQALRREQIRVRAPGNGGVRGAV